MSEYRATIGLEIHAELKTQTKMFCACLNDPDEKEPNKNICAVCLAHPGSLPVINRAAVNKVLMVGAAVGGLLPDYTEFDRKNYFYPDIPKGYQISQYKYPLVSGGAILGVKLTRIHLEEDTARSQHTGEQSLVDYNRAGVPLMELVTEPVIHDAETAGAFARELQLLLRYLGAGEANMEKGEMRVEANVSVSTDETLGTKVEVKNLNSFRSVERAIAYELKRQSALLASGKQVTQETRGWNEATQATFSQRKKEKAHDYRYFPDPDLPKLIISDISEFSLENLKKDLPELPWQKRERYIKLGLKSDDADMFVQQYYFGDFFDRVFKYAKDKKQILLAANYIANDVAQVVAEKEGPMIRLHGINKNAEKFAKLITLNADGMLSSRATKDILPRVIYGGEDPEEIAKKENLVQQSDTGTLEAIAQKIIDANPGPAADFKAGKEAALQFLVGQGMKESKGSANPRALREAITRLLA